MQDKENNEQIAISIDSLQQVTKRKIDFDDHLQVSKIMKLDNNENTLLPNNNINNIQNQYEDLSSATKSVLQDSKLQNKNQSQNSSKVQEQKIQQKVKQFTGLHSDIRAAQKLKYNQKYQENEPQQNKLQLAHKPGVIPNRSIFEPVKREITPIKFKPFNLSTDKRGLNKSQIFEMKKYDEQLSNEKLKQFTASPIPDYRQMAQENINLHVKQSKVTRPKEVKLNTSMRVSLYQQHNQNNNVEQEINTNFKASKMPDLSLKTPTKPPVRPSTQSKSPLLKSSIRAQNRQKFDEVQKQKELKQKEELELKKQQEEERIIKEQKLYKCQTQFKAKPITHYKQVQLQKSSISLTKPESPKLQTKFRVKNNQSNNNTDQKV